MAKQKNLDIIFEALANQHRRDIVYALGLMPHSISQLAAMQRLTLPAIYKHIKILEKSNLITKQKTGRTTFLTLNKEALQTLQNWLMQYHTYWGSSKASLENYANYLKGGDKK